MFAAALLKEVGLAIDLYDKGDHIKETFAYFGRAYYMANVFEIGLALAIIQLDFLKEQIEIIRMRGKDNFSQSDYEAAFDEFANRQHAQSLGNLIKRVYRLAEFDDEFRAEISKAKALRDLLAHHFFRENAEIFATRGGRDKMIAELDKAHEIFSSVDQRLSDFMGPFLSRIGLSNEKVEALFRRHMEEYMASAEKDEALG